MVKNRRCDKTVKTSVVKAEKRTNRVSIDSEVCVLPLVSRRSSFVLEPDYADIIRRRDMCPASLFCYHCFFMSLLYF